VGRGQPPGPFADRNTGRLDPSRAGYRVAREGPKTGTSTAAHRFFSPIRQTPARKFYASLQDVDPSRQSVDAALKGGSGKVAKVTIL